MPEGRSEGTGEPQQTAKEIFRPLDLHDQWEQRFLPLQGQTGRADHLGLQGGESEAWPDHGVHKPGAQFRHLSDEGPEKLLRCCVWDSDCKQTLLLVYSIVGVRGGSSGCDPLRLFVRSGCHKLRNAWGPFTACFLLGTVKCLKRLSTKGGSVIPALSFGLLAFVWGRVRSFQNSGGGGCFHVLQVGALESMWEILHRYLPYNAHAASYTWKYEGKDLNMDYTLEQNGIRDEDEEFDHLSVDSAPYTPAILLYFNDDLTEL